MSETVAPVPAPQEPTAGIGDGLAGILNVFFDPAATARRVVLRWFWIYPFLVSSAVTIYYQIALRPYSMKAIEAGMREKGMTGEQLQNALAMTQKFTSIGAFVTPVFILIFVALTAWLISVAASIIDVKTRFQHLVSLVMVTGMIPLLQLIGNVIVLRTKSIDDITSAQDLKPPFGLDIFLHDLPKALQAFIGFFSIFEIWTIIMLALIFAAMTGSTKGKAFFATSPAWLLGLIFAVIGGVFSS
jgi:hypothetical protein